MTRRSLPQSQHVSLDAVAARGARYPRLAELVGDRILTLGASPAHVDTAPRLLVLLGRTGRTTESLLARLDAAVRFFNAASRPGWKGVRRQLSRANEPGHFLSLSAELVVARWLERQGLRVLAFEPVTQAGKRPDLLIGRGHDRLFVEIVAPGTPARAIEAVNSRLHVGLERIESGLSVEVSGYEAHVNSLDPDQDANRVVTKAQADAVVQEFRREAAKLDKSDLPTTVIEARPGQPVSVAAVAHDPARTGTFVSMAWGESGLVPNVKRLVQVVREERKHLPDDPPGAILVDLSRWSDFRDAEFYLDQAKTELAGHRMPAFVGTFLWRSERFEPEARKDLHRDEAWAASELGQILTTHWARPE